MILAASLIVKNEADRYLRPCLDHLLTFCDVVRVFDDGSTDDFKEIGWYDDERVQIKRSSESTFMQHEGRARQELLDWTFEAQPTHVLAIDADEFVSDGQKLRDLCSKVHSRQGMAAWKISMREVWTATEEGLWTREDGLWGPRGCPILYELPVRRNAYRWKIGNRAASPGREPQAVLAMRHRIRDSGVDILHFGWANVADRAARYARYSGDNFGHNPTHIQSIMWGDDRVVQEPYAWPEALLPYKAAIVERAQRDRLGDEFVEAILDNLEKPVDAPGVLAFGGVDYAFLRKHPDGRWVGIKWDGTIETS